MLMPNQSLVPTQKAGRHSSNVQRIKLEGIMPIYKYLIFDDPNTLKPKSTRLNTEEKFDRIDKELPPRLDDKKADVKIEKFNNSTDQEFEVRLLTVTTSLSEDHVYEAVKRCTENLDLSFEKMPPK
jgi:hypothetical protein